MSDVAVSWLPVAPSAWRRRLRALAVAVSAGSVAAPAVAHLMGSQWVAGVAAVIVAGAAGLLAWRRAAPPDPREWRIEPDGRISVRSNGALRQDVPVLFISTIFIVLRDGSRTLEIWCDATPFQAFRRLSVAVRWRPPQRSRPRLTGSNRADAVERT